MKRLAVTSLGLALFSTFTTLAQTDAAPPTAGPAPQPASASLPRLPYGVDDVLKLTRAKVSEDVIVAFVENSGNAYSLRAQDIVYLRDQGVSDHVISVMLAQPQRIAQSTPPAVPQPGPAPQPAPIPQDYSQPAPVYSEPASSLYVIPYSTGYPYYSSYYSYGYPYYYPYYGYYGSYCYPRFGFSSAFCRPFGFNHRGFVAIGGGFGGRSGFGGHVTIGGHSGFTAHGSFGGGGRFSGGGGHFSGGGHFGGGGHMGGRH